MPESDARSVGKRCSECGVYAISHAPSNKHSSVVDDLSKSIVEDVDEALQIKAVTYSCSSVEWARALIHISLKVRGAHSADVP